MTPQNKKEQLVQMFYDMDKHMTEAMAKGCVEILCNEVTCFIEQMRNKEFGMGDLYEYYKNVKSELK